jgi:hypothetical protein
MHYCAIFLQLNGRVIVYLDETIRNLQHYADKDDGILYIEYC